MSRPSYCRQWLRQPIKVRETIASALVEVSPHRYLHISSLRNALLSYPNLQMICGVSKRAKGSIDKKTSSAFHICCTPRHGSAIAKCGNNHKYSIQHTTSCLNLFREIARTLPFVYRTVSEQLSTVHSTLLIFSLSACLDGVAEGLTLRFVRDMAADAAQAVLCFCLAPPLVA